MKLEYLSNTQIQMALKCGEQYRMRYVEGLRIPPGFAMIRGRVVDQAVSANLRQKIESRTDLPVEQVQQAARDSLSAQLQGEVKLDDDYGHDLKTAKGILTDEVVSLARLHTEKVSPTFQPAQVQLKIELAASESLSVPIQGVLDLVDERSTVRDTKASRKSPNKDAAETSDQLTTYDLLHRAHFREAPSGLQLDNLVRTPTGRVYEKILSAGPRSHEDLSALVARMGAVTRMVEAEIFTPAPDSAWWCSQKWCGYWGQCPYARGRARPKS